MKSIDEQMQEFMPGSKTFDAHILCPRCGWHFAKGFTDPSGTHDKLPPGAITICGECLAVIKFNDKLEPVLQTAEMLATWTHEDREAIAAMLVVVGIGRALKGPEPEGPMQ